MHSPFVSSNSGFDIGEQRSLYQKYFELKIISDEMNEGVIYNIPLKLAAYGDYCVSNTDLIKIKA